MSTYLKYDPELLVVERVDALSAELGDLIVGLSRLGADTTGWLPVPVASLSVSAGYTVDDNGTLIVDAETAALGLSFWHTPETTPLFPGDRVRATYAGSDVFVGTVDSTALTYATDPAAVAHGATHRVDFSASLVGTYAATMGAEVCWMALPGELAIDRIQRWVSVEGW